MMSNHQTWEQFEREMSNMFEFYVSHPEDRNLGDYYFYMSSSPMLKDSFSGTFFEEIGRNWLIIEDGINKNAYEQSRAAKRKAEEELKKELEVKRQRIAPTPTPDPRSLLKVHYFNNNQQSQSVLNDHGYIATRDPKDPVFKMPTPLDEIKRKRLLEAIKANNKENEPQNKPRLPQAKQKTEDIRKAHNAMERQRRKELAESFQKLKALIPELMSKPKASKQEICTKATEYIWTLRRQEEALIIIKEEEKKRKDFNEQKLNQMIKELRHQARLEKEMLHNAYYY